MSKSTPGSSSALVDFSDSSDEELDETPPEFYDPAIDDRDQAWVVRQRKGRKSDAVLSCPACFTTLCIDCQRHEKIVTQYRAMFVLNCKFVENKQSQNPVQGKRKRTVDNIGNATSQQALVAGKVSSVNNEMYKAVCCSVCGAEVAVMDKDEMYHFYNVMPSYA